LIHWFCILLGMRLLVLLTVVVCSIGVSNTRWSHNRKSIREWKKKNMVWFPASEPADCEGSAAETHLQKKNQASLQKMKREICNGKDAGERFCFCTSFVDSPLKYGCGTCELQLLYDWKSAMNKTGGDVQSTDKWGRHPRGFSHGKRGDKRGFRHSNGKRVKDGKPGERVANDNTLSKDEPKADLNTPNNVESKTFVHKKRRDGKPGRNGRDRRKPGKSGRSGRHNRPGKPGRPGNVAGSDKNGGSSNDLGSSNVDESNSVRERSRGRRWKKNMNKRLNKKTNKSNNNETSKKKEPTEAQLLKVEGIHQAKMKAKAAARAGKAKASAEVVKTKATKMKVKAKSAEAEKAAKAKASARAAKTKAANMKSKVDSVTKPAEAIEENASQAKVKVQPTKAQVVKAKAARAARAKAGKAKAADAALAKEKSDETV